MFTYIDSMLEFCKAFNGHSFADSSDILYNAVVEFAPYQGSHEEQKQKVDSTENTIDIGLILFNVRSRVYAISGGFKDSP